MTKDRKDIYERVTDRMIEKLEAGTVPWRKPWKNTGGADGMPCNANSKRPYNGFNLVVTLFSGYASPYWATYKGWKKLGGQVRKGEKGTLVVGWNRVEKEVDQEEDGVTRKVKKSFLVGFGFTVFNEEQVDGATVPERKTKGEELDPIESAEAVLQTWRETQSCSIKEGRSAYYTPGFDTVVVPPLKSFQVAELYYQVAFHELGHATGAESRLARFTKDEPAGTFGSESYSKEELVAELTAAFVNATLGLQAATEDYSAAYIKGWLGALRNDKKLVISAASKAQKAAEFILNGGQPRDEKVVEVEAVA